MSPAKDSKLPPDATEAIADPATGFTKSHKQDDDIAVSNNLNDPFELKGNEDSEDSLQAQPTKGNQQEQLRNAPISNNIPTTSTTLLIDVESSKPGKAPAMISDMPVQDSEDSIPPPPPPKDDKYSKKSPEPDLEKEAYKKEDMDFEQDNGGQGGAQEAEDDSRSEIQSIMEQFDPGMGGPGADEIMSPRLEIAGPLLGSPINSHPPRKSSLEPLRTTSHASLSQEASISSEKSESLPRRTSSLAMASATGLGISEDAQSLDKVESSSSPSSSRQHAPLPPQPDPEPDLPFDFHRFLEQLRHRTADPVAKFLRSFLMEFAKKQWMVHEQVKIISDFLEFITKKMAQCEVWRTVSDGEFDNACEGMEKLVMNRLYSQTFSPAIPPPDPSVGRRRKSGNPPPGRRGQHQEDVERDEILAQKVRIYSWVREEHLDIKPLNDKGKKFLSLAQQELLKIGNYRAPRDKVICVLNSCKVIFGFLRNSQHDQSADSFIPLLIYTVLRANPPNLVSNVQYILRFRNANKLTGEAGYYVSSLGGAIDFIERLDRTSLTISDEDFEKNVEASVSAIAEPHAPQESAQPALLLPGSKAESSSIRDLQDAPPLPTRPGPTKNAGSSSKSESENEENAAVAGLLRTIQRPLSTIGRIFSDDSSSTPNPQSVQTQPPATPQPPAGSQRLSPLPRAEGGKKTPESASRTSPVSAEEAAARQANQEAEDARRIRAREENHVVETLCGMFPALDREVVIDVVRANEGRIGSAVDACLALSS